MLLLLACAAEPAPGVVTGVDFGDVESVLLRPAWEGEATLYNAGALVLGARLAMPSQLLVSGLPGGCEAQQERERTWREASGALLDAADQGTDLDGLCEGMPALLDELAVAFPGSSALGLSCDDCELAELEPGVHLVGPDEAVAGAVAVDQPSVWERASETWADCRMDPAPAELSELSGELRIDATGPALEGAFEGVELSAEFASTECSIDLSGVLFIIE